MDTSSCAPSLTPLPDRPLKGKEKELIDSMLSSIIRPDAIVEDIIAGPSFIAVKAGDRMGLSSRLGASHRDDEKNLVSRMMGKKVKDMAELVCNPSPFAISLGFAALNAGNTPDPAGVEPSDFPADDLIAKLGKDKVTGLVGAFPFTESLKSRVGTFHLFELKDLPDAVPRDQWETVLGQLEVFAITGTALLTRGMAWFLSRAPQAKIVVLGPTTPISDTLFTHGVDYLCGSVVTDMDRVAESVRSGVSFKKIKRNGGIVFTQTEKQ